MSLCFLWVRKNPRKIPSKSPTKFSKFPCEKSKKKIHRRASAGARGERSIKFNPDQRFQREATLEVVCVWLGTPNQEESEQMGMQEASCP